MVLRDLAARPLELGPCPCDDCRHALRCASTGEACLSFAEFVRSGREGRWLLMPRQPRGDIGERMGFRLRESA